MLDDSSIINDILAHHVDASDRRAVSPSPGHLEALLNDDRTYLLAAIHGSKVTGFTLAYRFPSFYASEYLGYLYDIEDSLK
jgi:hypothetical protein